ncbi:hypothetical protein CF326_g6418 [Tilletia indica]|uniref:Uncharacterized protein n=1 Tax=Tilletia indica TaxID=43049 RepID=A0A8T8STF4_9BASI|nr:hypothetical protein CF326_g6418 [Tilletia indica]KAE8248571.1 hypothetical protein A4X13_0g5560 [Tilletia indica]
MEHIKDTIKANTPAFASAYIIERSAGAITFIPRTRETGRKIQVILRGFKNPATVLASFDLDPACSFFDGTEVWISPRAIRAFYTGFTTTTGAISSSFAARIIKYAARGYGVLVRPEDRYADTSELLQQMESILQRKTDLISTDVFNLHWSITGSFHSVFQDIKIHLGTNWTHSFSALATLAAIWKLAYTTGKIEDLQNEVGSTSHLYGVYENSDKTEDFCKPERWLAALEKISPALKGRKWTLRESIWKRTIFDAASAQEPLGLVVPLRQHLQSTGRFATLRRLRNTDDIRDEYGDLMEICLWTTNPETMWEPRDGFHWAAHQLLITAATLTVWTMWQVASGTAWHSLTYGRTLHNAVMFSLNAGHSQAGDFDLWMRA